jgi:hypothetical protein
MKRDVAKSAAFKGVLEENKFFDFSTPYGYGGWILEGNINIKNQFLNFMA